MNNGSNDRIADQRVSETYRNLASEQPPAHLDREVLRMARREGRTPYAAARAWMRPFAWAGTIALCLAIVMQVTQLPRDAVEFDSPAPAEQEPATVSPAPGSAEPEAADAFQPRADVPVATPGKEQVSGDWRAGEAPAMAGKAVRFSQDGARADSRSTAPPVTPAAGPVAEEDEAAPTQPVPHLERSAVSEVMPSTAAELRSVAAAMADKAEPLCAAEERASASRWYDCIEALRDSVPEDRLAQEIADFETAYPEFAADMR